MHASKAAEEKNLVGQDEIPIGRELKCMLLWEKLYRSGKVKRAPYTYGAEGQVAVNCGSLF